MACQLLEELEGLRRQRKRPFFMPSMWEASMPEDAHGMPIPALKQPQNPPASLFQ